MKLAIGAALVGVTLATFAFAQSPSTDAASSAAVSVPASKCGALPPAPAIPDGAVAKQKDMQAAETAVNAWYAQAKVVHDCSKGEFDAAKANMDAARAVAQARVAENQSLTQQINSTIEGWKKSSDAYQARSAPKKKN